ncbi:MAG: flavin reductase family protein [Anaerolineae bacterium]|nr:flavin reductase family protein [Anaerolineae bacterium]
MEINPIGHPTAALQKLLNGSVIPRPIGWISTLNADGRPNLAPFSYFTVVCVNPPHILYCPGRRGLHGTEKDSLANARRQGEFVVNIVTEALAPAMNLTSSEVGPEVDEFALAGLTVQASVAVAPPRVAESPIHFECRVTHIVDVSDGPSGGSIVVGQVVHIHVGDALLMGDKINMAELHAIGRLAGASYTRVTDVFDMPRPGGGG